MQCLVAGHVHHTSVGQGADLDQVVSLDELARVPGDVLELSLDLFAQHAVEVFGAAFRSASVAMPWAARACGPFFQFSKLLASWR